MNASLHIAAEDVSQALGGDNPWWDGETIPSAGDRPRTRAHFPKFRDLALNWQVRRTVVLMGPRRVGKTVMLLQLVRHALDRGFPGRNILYASLDTPLYSGTPPARLVSLFEEATGHDPASRRIVIFDEVQYLQNWEVHLKVLTDRCPATRFIVSGSAGATLRRRSPESGAGRFTDFLLPPLTFAEFLQFRDQEQLLMHSVPGNGGSRFETADIQALNDRFVDYINFGGYPEAALRGPVQQNFCRFAGRDIVDRVLRHDLPSLYGIRNIPELNRLLAHVACHSGREVSLQALAEASGAAKNTIMNYLEYLEAAFLILRVHRVDQTARTFKRARNFKIYLTNPSMRAVLIAPVTADDDAMGALAETAIISQWYHSPRARDIRYARWKAGRTSLEVDLVAVNPGTFRPAWSYEIKWSDRSAGRPDELRGLLAFARQNSLAAVGAATRTRTARTTVDGIDVRFVTCAEHCYRVGRRLADDRDQ